MIQGAVAGQDHEHKIYYERTIQTLEQQLLDFQQQLGAASGLIGAQGGKDVLGPANAQDSCGHLFPEGTKLTFDLEEGKASDAVAEYVHQCKCVLCLVNAHSSLLLRSMGVTALHCKLSPGPLRLHCGK